MIKNKNLLLIASFVWIVAGFNVLKIGVTSYKGNIYFLNLFFTIIIFLIFWKMVFCKLVKKHTLRIKQYSKPKHPFWCFFDLKSFFIMTIMIALGVTIRRFNLMPNQFIAIFYSGLGTALTLAGFKFAINYTQYNL